MTDDRLEKIVFLLEQDDDGYPPDTREALWAKRLSDGDFVIDSIPFFVCDISPEDEVEAQLIDNELRFSRLVKPSGISTFHLILADPEDNVNIRKKIDSMQCKSEYNARIGLIAVEVPKSTPIEPFLQFIMTAKSHGVLDYEEAALRHSIT